MPGTDNRPCYAVAVAFFAVASGLFVSTGVAAQTPVSTDPSAESVRTASVVTGPVVKGVYRSTGANGEVEFNNFGNGEPVAVALVPPSDEAELERVAARSQDMLDVASVLAADREVRESRRAAQRDAVRQERAVAAREQARLAEWVAATEPRYYPAYFPRRGSGYGRRHGAGYGSGWRPRSGPYREEYRYPDQSAMTDSAAGPGAQPAPSRPTHSRKF